MQHNFSNAEWASRAHSFVRDGVWPFVYDSVSSACEAFVQCVRARGVFRGRLGGAHRHHVQALAKLSFHLNARASDMDQRVMIERRALVGIGNKAQCVRSGRAYSIELLRRRNAISAYRRLDTEEARALYRRWGGPSQSVVDATSMSGSLELFTDDLIQPREVYVSPPPSLKSAGERAAKVFKWPEPSPAPPIPSLRFLGEHRGPGAALVEGAMALREAPAVAVACPAQRENAEASVRSLLASVVQAVVSSFADALGRVARTVKPIDFAKGGSLPAHGCQLSRVDIDFGLSDGDGGVALSDPSDQSIIVVAGEDNARTLAKALLAYADAVRK